MKRILLACFLLTATCTVFSIQHATAQGSTPHITQSAFMVKVNALDALIGAGSMTAADAKWEELHVDMINLLGVTKASIASSTTPTDKAHYTTVMTNQRDLYSPLWQMHTNLAGNRVDIKNKLTAFAALIY